MLLLSNAKMADLNNLKMRKLSTILGIIIVFLLNAVSTSVCYYDDVSRLEATSSVNQADSRLIEPLDNVEVDSLLSNNNNNNKDINNIEGRDHTGSSDLSTCQLVQIVHLLRYPGCQPKAIASFACSGSCASYVKRERSCSCCQQTGSQEATFALDCPSLDPPYRKVKTHAPIECLCRSCTDLGREDIRPQELVEALSGQVGSKLLA